jgi:hypothetical protein
MRGVCDVGGGQFTCDLVTVMAGGIVYMDEEGKYRFLLNSRRFSFTNSGNTVETKQFYLNFLAFGNASLAIRVVDLKKTMTITF